MTANLKTSVVILFIASMAVLFACNRRSQPHITGNLVGLPDGKVWLYRYNDSIPVKTDSTYSRDGRFRLTHPGRLPDISFVNFEALPDFYIPVLTDGPDIYISGNLNYKEDLQVSGTEGNEKLRNYVRSIRDVDIMARTIELQLSEWENDSITMDSLKYRSLSRKRDRLRSQITRSREDFITENPSNIVSAMFLNAALNDSMSYRQVDSLISRLDSTIIDNAFSRRLNDRLRELAN